MIEWLDGSAFFGILLSIGAYFAGTAVRKKVPLALANPLLIAVLLVWLVYRLTPLDFAGYKDANAWLQYLLTPATICLAVVLHEELPLLKRNALPMLAGIVAGVLANAAIVLLFSACFHLDHTLYVTFLPKSVTTAIGVALSQELGGIENLTVLVIILTGILGNIAAGPVCRIFRITHPLAKGIGIGAASHIIGTTKALEMGKEEGAASSLATVVTGLATVACGIVFAQFY